MKEFTVNTTVGINGRIGVYTPEMRAGEVVEITVRDRPALETAIEEQERDGRPYASRRHKSILRLRGRGLVPSDAQRRTYVRVNRQNFWRQHD